MGFVLVAKIAFVISFADSPIPEISSLAKTVAELANESDLLDSSEVFKHFRLISNVRFGSEADSNHHLI